MSILTTQTSYVTSGVNNTWLNSQPTYSQIRNSGGIVNIAGPIFVKAVIVNPASGRYTDASASGIVLAVNHATSGQFAQLSGEELFRFDGGSHSGLGTANTVFVPTGPSNIDFIARSGIVTLNSGTHVYDIIVLYAGPQA